MKKHIQTLLTAMLGLTLSLTVQASDNTPTQSKTEGKIYVGYQGLDDDYSKYDGIKVGYTRPIANTGIMLGGELSYNKSDNALYESDLLDFNFNAGFDLVSLITESDNKVVPYLKAGFGLYNEDYARYDVSEFGTNHGVGIRFISKHGLYIDASLIKQEVNVMHLSYIDLKWTGIAVGWAF